MNTVFTYYVEGIRDGGSAVKAASAPPGQYPYRDTALNIQSPNRRCPKRRIQNHRQARFVLGGRRGNETLTNVSDGERHNHATLDLLCRLHWVKTQRARYPEVQQGRPILAQHFNRGLGKEMKIVLSGRNESLLGEHRSKIVVIEW